MTIGFLNTYNITSELKSEFNLTRIIRFVLSYNFNIIQMYTTVDKKIANENQQYAPISYYMLQIHKSG